MYSTDSFFIVRQSVRHTETILYGSIMKEVAFKVGSQSFLLPCTAAIETFKSSFLPCLSVRLTVGAAAGGASKRTCKTAWSVDYTYNFVVVVFPWCCCRSNDNNKAGESNFRGCSENLSALSRVRNVKTADETRFGRSLLAIAGVHDQASLPTPACLRSKLHFVLRAVFAEQRWKVRSRLYRVTIN